MPRCQQWQALAQLQAVVAAELVPPALQSLQQMMLAPLALALRLVALDHGECARAQAQLVLRLQVHPFLRLLLLLLHRLHHQLVQEHLPLGVALVAAFLLAHRLLLQGQEGEAAGPHTATTIMMTIITMATLMVRAIMMSETMTVTTKTSQRITMMTAVTSADSV